VSLQFLTQELAFHGEEGSEEGDAEAGDRQCLEFISQYGADYLVDRKENGVRVMTGKAGALFENARAAAFRSVDIKGQI